jgi:hypothetical protein
MTPPVELDGSTTLADLQVILEALEVERVTVHRFATVGRWHVVLSVPVTNGSRFGRGYGDSPLEAIAAAIHDLEVVS